MVDFEDVCDKVATFLEHHQAGWILEASVKEFLAGEVSLRDLCIALTQVRDMDTLDKLMKFLESAIPFPSIASDFLHEEFQPYLIAAARSPSERLRNIVADALVNAKKTTIPNEVDLELLMILLQDEDTGVSSKAGRVVVQWMRALSKSSDETELARRLVTYYSLNRSSLDDTQQFRYISLFIEVGSVAEEVFREVSNGGVYDVIAHSLLTKADDILVKLGSLTLIEALARYEAGRAYLARSDVLLALDQEVDVSRRALTDSTTVVSLLYSMAALLPYMQDVQQVKKVLSGHMQTILPEFIISTNSAERMCGMKIISLLSVGGLESFSVEPILAFLKKNWKLFDQIGFALSDTDVEVVNSAVDCIVQVCRNWEGNPFMESESAQSRVISQLLATFQRHPFPEFRALAYSALAGMVKSEQLSDSSLASLLSEKSSSSVRMALLDPQSESNYDARTAKCDLVRVLVRIEGEKSLGKFFTQQQITHFMDFAQTGNEHSGSRVRDEMETEAS